MKLDHMLEEFSQGKKEQIPEKMMVDDESVSLHSNGPESLQSFG